MFTTGNRNLTMMETSAFPQQERKPSAAHLAFTSPAAAHLS